MSNADCAGAAHQQARLTPAVPASSNTDSDTARAPGAPRSWAGVLARYRDPNPARSALELAITALPLAALWASAALAFSFGYWWICALLVVPAAAFLVRLFCIQHDCGHGSFFRHRKANDWLGRVLGIFTLTPYDLWRQTHAIHHNTCGNLDRRGIGDVDTLTVREYLARSAMGRLKYRIYRHPLVMFGVGPAYLFFVQQRLPVGLMTKGLRPWLSAMGTNAAIALFVAVLIWLLGWKPFVAVHGSVMLLAASAGVWLFYVQHQFEGTIWSNNETWRMHDAALHGSSYYSLPGVLAWFTANIGVHHVHHLCNRVPFYRLPEVLRDHPELARIGRLSLGDSLRCVSLALWDEDRQRLISFRDMTRSRA